MFFPLLYDKCQTINAPIFSVGFFCRRDEKLFVFPGKTVQPHGEIVRILSSRKKIMSPLQKKRFEEKGFFFYLLIQFVREGITYNEPEFGERKKFLSSQILLLSAGKRSGKDGNFSCFRTRKTLFFPPPPSLATTNVRKIPQDYI